jgi:hypothetical protein
MHACSYCGEPCDCADGERGEWCVVPCPNTPGRPPWDYYDDVDEHEDIVEDDAGDE